MTILRIEALIYFIGDFKRKQKNYLSFLLRYYKVIVVASRGKSINFHLRLCYKAQSITTP